MKPVEDFSLAVGGPLNEFYLRARLAWTPLEGVRRRVIGLALLTWLPLLLLCVVAGTAWGGGIAVPFLYDFEVHLRFLIVLPLLLVQEVVLHARLRIAVQQMVIRDLVPGHQLPRLERILLTAIRLRDSVAAELLLVVIVAGLGTAAWRAQHALAASTWYAIPGEAGFGLTPAGRWLAWVAIPVFQFLLLRTYYRLALWISVLIRVSRLDLQLVPTHPDRSGGLGFLGQTTRAFIPLLLAHGTLLAGSIANRIFHEQAKLADFKLEIAGLTAILLLLLIGPLFAFMPGQLRCRRAGLREYGLLANRYVREFDDKWVHTAKASAEPLLGSPDIQSLADLANSYGVVSSMRTMPMDRMTVLLLAAATLLPFLPLTLTMIPLEELIKRLIQAVL